MLPLDTKEWIIEGRKLTSVDSGKGKNLIILLPGYSLSGTWAIEHYVSSLKDAKVYALNFPGFHGSELIGQSLRIDLLYQWINMIMVEENIDKIQLIGHSFGGRIALLLANEYPEIISELTLIAPVSKVHELEAFLNYLPKTFVNRFYNFLLKGQRLLGLGRFLKKLGIIGRADLSYLEKQYQDQITLERLRYYGRSISQLKLTDSIIKKAFNKVYLVDLYLSKTDTYSKYSYWKNITNKVAHVKILTLEGGHFGKIRN